MADSETPVKKHELDRVSERFEDHKTDADNTHRDLRQDVKDLEKKIKEDYVTNDKLDIRLAPMEGKLKLFWTLAGVVGMMMLGTAYQFVMNGLAP